VDQFVVEGSFSVALCRLEKSIKLVPMDGTRMRQREGGRRQVLQFGPVRCRAVDGGQAGERLRGDSIPAMVKALGGIAWDPEDSQLTRESLDEAHRLGLKVVVWSWPDKLGTAFDAKLAARMIDWGVDGIITDDPGRLISMLAARGWPVPDRY